MYNEKVFETEEKILIMITIDKIFLKLHTRH